MVEPIVIVCVTPCWTQVVPLADRSPVTTLPTRVMRIQ